MAAILKYDVISKIDAHLPKERFCQISSRSDLKWRNIGLYRRGRPQQEQQDE